MFIADPSYDVVFSYLLKDEKVTRLILSALLGKGVLELAPLTALRPPVKPRYGTECLALRWTFSATVRQEDGSPGRTVIELLKAKNAWDLQQNRHYLGPNPCLPENVDVEPGGRQEAPPLLTIAFLAEGLEGFDLPVLGVNRPCVDLATGDEVPITDPLVNSLTPGSIVVQMDRLKNRRRTDLERFLAVFDRSQTVWSYRCMLNVPDADYPERSWDVFERLLRAGAEQNIRDGMDVEDDVVSAFKDQARKNAQALEERERAIEARNKVLEALDRAIEARDKALEERDQVIAGLERQLRGT